MKKATKKTGFFTRLPLKRIIQISLLSVVFILLVIFTLGVREWSIHNQCSSLLEESRLLRAHFTEFNEYITEQLLAGLSLNEEKTAYEAALIGQEGSDLAARPLVPEEFKLLLVNRGDMTKLMARIRLLSTQTAEQNAQLTIYRMLSNINNRVTRFDDSFWQYIQQRQQAAQNLLRGTLALATVFLATLLFLLYASIGRTSARQKESHSQSSHRNRAYRQFTAEELRLISLSLLNELPPQRKCHNVMSYANGIINCAQILKDQENNTHLQEEENQKLIIDLWQEGRKIADAVLHLQSLQQLYTSPVTSIDDAIDLLIRWLTLQFPEVSQIIEEDREESLPPVRIPAGDLFLAMALHAEQIIPEPGHDYPFLSSAGLQIQTHLQDAEEEADVILEMVIGTTADYENGSERETATHMRERISNDLLTHYGGSFEALKGTGQSINYRFLLK